MRRDRHTAEQSRAEILRAAMRIARMKGGWLALTRKRIAMQMGCSESLIFVYFGNMPEFREAVIRCAIERNCLSIIRQAIVAGGDYKIPVELRKRALSSLV